MKTKVYESKVSQSNCPVCQQKIEMHMACSGCGVLIGPEHIEIKEYILGKIAYCYTCYKARGGILNE